MSKDPFGRESLSNVVYIFFEVCVGEKVCRSMCNVV